MQEESVKESMERMTERTISKGSFSREEEFFSRGHIDERMRQNQENHF